MQRSREDEERVKEGGEQERPFMHIYTLTWTEEKLAGSEDGQEEGGRRKEEGGRRKERRSLCVRGTINQGRKHDKLNL